MSRLARSLLLIVGLTGPVHAVQAQDRRLYLQASDLDGGYSRGIRFKAGGNSPTGDPTDRTGRTWIMLPSTVRAGDQVSLEIVQQPGREWVFISPYDSLVTVPAARANPASTFAQIVVARRGAPLLLVDGRAVKSITEAILRRMSPGPIRSAMTREVRDEALRQAAERYGVSSSELERAIQSWAQKTNDPSEKALAAQYESNFPRAVELGLTSIKAKKSELLRDYLVVAESLFWLGKYVESIDVFKDALPSGPTNTRLLNELAFVLALAGRYQEAAPFYELALEQADRGQPDEEALAVALNGLGDVYFRQAHYGDAVRVYTRAFALKDSPYIDVTIQGIGRVFLGLGRYADAEQAFKRALETRERALGPNDYRVAITLNDLGSFCLYQRRYADAEPLLRRALLIFKSDPRFGLEHPFVAPVLGHLGRALAGQGKLDEAETMYLEAIGITEKALGPEHIDLATDLTKLALLYAEQGKQSDAERAYRRAIAIYEKALGDHPDLAQCLHGLGVLYQVQGRNTEAADLFTRSLAMIEKTLGSDSTNAAAVLVGLAQLRVTDEKYLEAETLFQRALAIMEKAREPDVGAIADVLDEYAAVLRRLAREREATEAEARARSIRKRPEGREARG